MTFELPEKESAAHKDVLIELYRDGTLINSVVKLKHNNEIIKVEYSWNYYSYSSDLSASYILGRLNGELSAHGLVLDRNEFEPVLSKLLKKFYPNRED